VPPEVGPCLLRLSGTQILLTVPAVNARKYETLVIHYKWNQEEYVYPSHVPPLLTSSEPAIEDAAIETTSKTQNFIKIKGTRLDCVAKINFTAPGSASPEKAEFACSPDNSSLTVFLSAGQKAGFGQLIALGKDQSVIGKVDVLVKE
jgi:hypothetical protein